MMAMFFSLTGRYEDLKHMVKKTIEDYNVWRKSSRSRNIDERLRSRAVLQAIGQCNHLDGRRYILVKTNLSRLIFLCISKTNSHNTSDGTKIKEKRRLFRG